MDGRSPGVFYIFSNRRLCWGARSEMQEYLLSFMRTSPRLEVSHTLLGSTSCCQIDKLLL